MDKLLQKLEGGDMRYIGYSDEVVAEVLANPARFEPLFQGLYHADPRVRMRAADALEKISTRRCSPLLKELAATGSPAMRSRGRKLLRRLDVNA